MLIINADDFGASQSINTAITDSFAHGWCSSATIIPNYPQVEEAFQLAHEQRLTGKLGVHLNLVTLAPLTEAMKWNATFCIDGAFNPDWRTQSARGIHLSTAEKAVVADELRAQIRRCRQAHLPVTHIDSHTHAHTIPGVADIVLGVAKESGIRAVRISRNCGKTNSLLKEIYRWWFNARLRRHGFHTTAYFGEIHDILYSFSRHLELVHRNQIEIMIHPDIIDGKILDADRQELGASIACVPGYKAAVSYTEFLAKM